MDLHEYLEMEPDAGEFTAEQLANFVKNWAGDEKVMLWYTVPAAVVMFLQFSCCRG